MHSKRGNGILLIGNFFSSKIGTRGVCEDLAVRLSDSGWRVITTSHKLGRVLRLLDMITTVWRRRREYEVAQIDVYSDLAFFWAEVVCWTLRCAKKPYILTLHGGNLPAFAQRWKGRVRRLLCSANAVTAPSGYLFEQMKTYRNDLLLIPNALDLSIYRFRLRERPKPNLIWLRAFHHIYNPLLAIKSLALIVNDFPNSQLTMVGPDKGDRTLKHVQSLVKEMGLDGRISMPGGITREEVPKWMNKGDIFLNTTNVDNAPVSMIEAMACGLCVVSTNVGGIPYLLEEDKDALLVPPGNPQSLACAVRRIMTEAGLAENLSRNARHKAEQFDWKLILPRWERLFEEMLAYS